MGLNPLQLITESKVSSAGKQNKTPVEAWEKDRPWWVFSSPHSTRACFLFLSILFDSFKFSSVYRAFRLNAIKPTITHTNCSIVQLGFTSLLLLLELC